MATTTKEYLDWLLKEYDLISKDDLRNIAEQLRLDVRIFKLKRPKESSASEWADGYFAGCESCAKGIEQLLNMDEEEYNRWKNIRADFQKSVLNGDVSHELWAAAQLLPGEGIEDGVNRVSEILETHFFQKIIQIKKEEHNA